MYFTGSSGGSKGDGRTPTAQNFLNFMQFFGKFGKIICWRPPEGWRPSYGESWIPPWDPIILIVLTVCVSIPNPVSDGWVEKFNTA